MKNIGSFAFKNLGDGCLVSKYLHVNNVPYIECAKSDKDTIHVFEGTYHASWLQKEGKKRVSYKLAIKKKPKFKGVYLVEFKNEEGSDSYLGEGMLFENLLIGHYWLKK